MSRWALAMGESWDDGPNPEESSGPGSPSPPNKGWIARAPVSAVRIEPTAI